MAAQYLVYTKESLESAENWHEDAQDHWNIGEIPEAQNDYDGSWNHVHAAVARNELTECMIFEMEN